MYLARHNLTNGSKVVLKASNKDDSNLAREIHHHRQFIHPHIARLYEVVVTENQVWLVLEYCPGDELYNYLCGKGALPVETAQKIFTQLVGAVAYIHSKQCVHRDLKLENVLLDKHENVKLVDFGFTREYEGKANYLQTFCGTVCYSAPEMLRGEKYAGEKVDVWSLGIILYALLKGELPFDEDDDVATKAKILKDEPTYPDTFPEGAKKLISKLLSKRPFPRPTLAEVLADPFLIDYAPHQQAILKLSQPAPFTTNLEKTTLERMKSAGVDIDKVIENVLSQRCDALAGWWALLIEKESRKEARKERKRKEREADLKLLRRLSGASGRFSTLQLLEQVDEEVYKDKLRERPRSSSRGRGQRRSTPQILVTDLPQLPEGSALDSPSGLKTPPTPIDKDSIRSRSGSRPPIPPKESARRRRSTLQLVTTNPDLLAPPAITNGIGKRRVKRKNNQFLTHMEKFRSWFIENTKRAKSPGKSDSIGSGSKSGDSNANSRPITGNDTKESSPLAERPQHDRQISTTSSLLARNSYDATLTPVTSNGINTKIDTNTARQRPHRNSLSPSPITPRSSIYRRSSGGVGLRGRKSTSSSVSSIRSLPRHKTHSKASSRSSNSMETVQSPASRSVGRSPHASVKVLPATPSQPNFSSSGRFVRHSNPHVADLAKTPELNEEPTSTSGKFNETAFGFGGVMFAKRGKKAFKGPMLNPSLFANDRSTGQGSPAVASGMPRQGSAGQLNMGLKDLVSRKREKMTSSDNMAHRKSLILEEEDEEEEEQNHAIIEEDEEEEDVDIEEVDEFSDVETGLLRGERVHSIVIYDEPPGLKGLGLSSEALDQDVKAGAFEKAIDSPAISPGQSEDPISIAGKMETTPNLQPSATMAGRWDEHHV